MTRAILGAAVLAFVLAQAGAADPVKSAGGAVVHDVFFSLKESTPAAKAKLVEACKKYLTNHPGTVFFAAGVVGDEFKREVNDRDWDVGLHIVFESKAAHDKYQDAERHLKFIEENKDSWKKVRVFDTVSEK